MFHRLVALLLMLLLTAFPVATSGMIAHCGLEPCGAEHQTPPSDGCCAKHQSAASEDQPDGAPKRSSCPKCMHACCRTADVVHAGVSLIPDRIVVCRSFAPVSSLHDPIACDAIFHPPRA